MTYCIWKKGCWWLVSDFLSKFDKKSPQPTETEGEKAKKSNDHLETSQEEDTAQTRLSRATQDQEGDGFVSQGEVLEKDPNYQKKRQQKGLLIGLVMFLCLAASAFGYYKISYVALPDFKGKPISDARVWAKENNLKITVEPQHHLTIGTNQVINQKPTAQKKIKKNKTVTVIVSRGPNPDEAIALPAFTSMTKADILAWKEKVKGENVTLIEEFDKVVKAGNFLREEFKNKDLERDAYKRGDQLIIYVSKGKEIYKKDIAMPDFKGKTKGEAEKWGKSHLMALTFKEEVSETVEAGSIMAQSIPPDEKIAKETKHTLTVSLGKGTVIPDFAVLTAETASAVPGLNLQVQELFMEGVPYGNLISQSIPPGESVPVTSEIPVKVVYSAGSPYLKSYFELTEGELAKAFFDDYRSKGAQIGYTTYYVDSAEERGKVVKMSAYNTYVGMNYTVSIGISNGHMAPDPGETPRHSSDPGADEDVPKESNTSPKNGTDLNKELVE